MIKWLKKQRKKQKISGIMQAMLKPLLLPLVAVIDTTLEGWKLMMIGKLKLADPRAFIGLFSDSVDALRTTIKEQINKVIGE